MVRGIALVLFLLVAGFVLLRLGGPAIDGLIAVDISQLLKEPNKFDGRPVTVRGIVVGSAGVLGVGGFRLKQGAAEIFVISAHGTPITGSDVTVSGTFKQALTVGD